MENLTVKVLILNPMEQFIKDLGLMISLMASELRSKQTEVNMKDSISMEARMGLENGIVVMGLFMKENFKIILFKEKERLCGLINGYIKVALFRARCKVKVFLTMEMEESMKVNSMLISEVDMAP